MMTTWGKQQWQWFGFHKLLDRNSILKHKYLFSVCTSTLIGLSWIGNNLLCEGNTIPNQVPIQDQNTSFQVRKAILESRARALYKQIRCLECGNGQTVEFSGAPSANEIRQLVWDLLVEGHSEEDIKGAVEAQYGHKVWMTPKFEKSQLLDVSLPFIGVAICLGLLYIRYFAPKSPKILARQLAKVDIESSYVYERRLIEVLTPPGRKP